MMATETVPEFVTTTKTETERIENSREVDEEEEEKIRRQKKSEEEVLEAKCLPGIISAYLKYVPLFLFFLSTHKWHYLGGFNHSRRLV